MCIVNHLRQRLRCHSSAPNNGLVHVGKESYRHDFHAIAVHRSHLVVAIDIHGHRLGVLNVKHQRRRRTIDISINQPNFESHLLQCNSQICSNCAFTNTAFTGCYSDDVLNAWNRGSFDDITRFFFGFFAYRNIHDHLSFDIYLVMYGFHNIYFKLLFRLKGGADALGIYNHLVAKNLNIKYQVSSDYVFRFGSTHFFECLKDI